MHKAQLHFPGTIILLVQEDDVSRTPHMGKFLRRAVQCPGPLLLELLVPRLTPELFSASWPPKHQELTEPCLQKDP